MCFPLNFKMLFPKGDKKQYDWPSTVAQIRSQVLLAWDCIAKAINSAFLLKLKSAGWHPTEFPKFMSCKSKPYSPTSWPQWSRWRKADWQVWTQKYTPGKQCHKPKRQQKSITNRQTRRDAILISFNGSECCALQTPMKLNPAFPLSFCGSKLPIDVKEHITS